ncbi:hypothetical protein R8Z50_17775 [Longispora sp. K20-0274]|uniref:hypothetical protein n=1 Tax=Longispora sp. K20-0274 TaxID=3088255 RepID=UPI00399C213B
MAADADRLGLATVTVDGALGLDETEELLAERLGPVIDAWPRRMDGPGRTRARRAENAVVNRQIAAYVADAGIAQFPFRYACECAEPGCGRQVELTPDGYRRAGGALAH